MWSNQALHGNKNHHHLGTIQKAQRRYLGIIAATHTTHAWPMLAWFYHGRTNIEHTRNNDVWNNFLRIGTSGQRRVHCLWCLLIVLYIKHSFDWPFCIFCYVLQKTIFNQHFSCHQQHPRLQLCPPPIE